MRVIKLSIISSLTCALLLSACGTVAVATDHGIDVMADVPAVTDIVGADEGSAADVKDVAETIGSDAVLPGDTVEPIDAVQPDTTGSDTVESADLEVAADATQSDESSSTDADIVADTAADIVVQPFYALVTPAEANALIQANVANPKFHIIDVRAANEFATGHIAGAQNVNVQSGSFSQDIGAFARDEVYFVYCASQHRSPTAIATMQDLAFLTLYELKGGLGNWTTAGYPTTID